MQKLFTAKEDEAGVWVSFNGVRYSISSVDKKDIKIPDSRAHEFEFHGSEAEYAQLMGLVNYEA